MSKPVEAFVFCPENAPNEKLVASGVPKKCHGSLRSIYNRICADTKRRVTDKKWLQSAVFTVNFTKKPEGLCLALVVFETISRFARTITAQVQTLLKHWKINGRSCKKDHFEEKFFFICITNSAHDVFNSLRNSFSHLRFFCSGKLQKVKAMGRTFQIYFYRARDGCRADEL